MSDTQNLIFALGAIDRTETFGVGMLRLYKLQYRELITRKLDKANELVISKDREKEKEGCCVEKC